MMASWRFRLIVATGVYFVLGPGGSVAAADQDVGYAPLLSKTDSSKLEKWKGVGMEPPVDVSTLA
jgi:hypothetical protein